MQGCVLKNSLLHRVKGVISGSALIHSLIHSASVTLTGIFCMKLLQKSKSTMMEWQRSMNFTDKTQPHSTSGGNLERKGRDSSKVNGDILHRGRWQFLCSLWSVRISQDANCTRGDSSLTQVAPLPWESLWSAPIFYFEQTQFQYTSTFPTALQSRWKSKGIRVGGRLVLWGNGLGCHLTTHYHTGVLIQA